MTTIIYTGTGKVIQIRHVDKTDFQEAVKRFGNYEIVKNYQDIGKIDKDITTMKWFKEN